MSRKHSRKVKQSVVPFLAKLGAGRSPMQALHSTLTRRSMSVIGIFATVEVASYHSSRMSASPRQQFLPAMSFLIAGIAFAVSVGSPRGPSHR